VIHIIVANDHPHVHTKTHSHVVYGVDVIVTNKQHYDEATLWFYICLLLDSFLHPNRAVNHAELVVVMGLLMSPSE
jgi:hypothetical protein